MSSKDGLIEYVDAEGEYIEAALASIESDAREYLAGSPNNITAATRHRLCEATLDCSAQMAELLQRIEGKEALELARAAIELGMRAVDARETINIKRLEYPLWRDSKLQRNKRVPRGTDINDWIEKQLCSDPGAKSPALWSNRPQWIEDKIGKDRFAKRVTVVRKELERKRVACN